jgi:hypothetical protein
MAISLPERLGNTGYQMREFLLLRLSTQTSPFRIYCKESQSYSCSSSSTHIRAPSEAHSITSLSIFSVFLIMGKSLTPASHTGMIGALSKKKKKIKKY